MTLKDATGEDRGYTLIAIPTCLVEPLLDPMRDKPADGAEEALYLREVVENAVLEAARAGLLASGAGKTSEAALREAGWEFCDRPVYRKLLCRRGAPGLRAVTWTDAAFIEATLAVRDEITPSTRAVGPPTGPSSSGNTSGGDV